MIGFEWNTRKAVQNLIEHKVGFDQAAEACRDPFAIVWVDEREDYGEERFSLLGLYGREVLHVTYTERGANIRIISARRAERREQDRYYRQNAP